MLEINTEGMEAFGFNTSQEVSGFNLSQEVCTNMSDFNGSMCEIWRYYHQGHRWEQLNDWSQILSNIMISILFLYYIAGCLVGASLNLFLIVVLIKFKKLHQIDFCLTLQIVFVDFLFCIFLFPISATNSVSRQWIYSPGFCHFAGVLGLLIVKIRCSFLFILTLDRLGNVFFPLRYPNIQKRFVAVLSAMAWTISAILALLPLYGLLDCINYAPEYHGCTLGSGCKHRTACNTFGLITAVVLNGIVVTALIMYFAMYFKAKKINSRVIPASTTIRDEAAAKRNRHAMVTLALYIIVLFALSSPQLLFNAIPLVLEDAIGFDFLPVWYNIVHVITVNLVLAISFVDPIVLMRNRDVRMVVNKILKRIKDKLQKLRRKLLITHKINEEAV